MATIQPLKAVWRYVRFVEDGAETGGEVVQVSSNTSARIDGELPGKHPDAELPCTTADPNGVIEYWHGFQRLVFFNHGEFSHHITRKPIFTNCLKIPRNRACVAVLSAPAVEFYTDFANICDHVNGVKIDS